MRVLMTMEFDNDKASRVIQDKRLGDLIQTVLKPLNPEAVYFTTVHGHRGGIVVFDLQEPAQMPSVAEPLFQELGAEINIQPAMTVDDVTRALV